MLGRIGIGSLSGIALAVYLGGPGTLFWIWFTSLFCATATFAETILSSYFKVKEKGTYYGGPFYYISQGLGKKTLAFLYAFIVLVAYIGGFLSIQVNTVSKSLNELYSIPSILVGIIFAILTAFTIIGGIKKIASVTSKLVPFMTLFYLTFCFYILAKNYNEIPNIIFSIFNSAFNFNAFGAGTISTLLLGMQKGIFSSEVGLRHWIDYFRCI